MHTWTGEPWEEQKMDNDRLYQAIRRAGVQRVRPTGIDRLEAILGLVGLAFVTALLVGGLFFWIGVIQAWVKMH